MNVSIPIVLHTEEIKPYVFDLGGVDVWPPEHHGQHVLCRIGPL
jgi:hypothetical protein